METKKEVVPKAVLVLAGLADPCGNIGTEGRYELLPIPWDQIEFAAHGLCCTNRLSSSV